MILRQKYCYIQPCNKVWDFCEVDVSSKAEAAFRCGLVEGRSSNTGLTTCALVVSCMHYSVNKRLASLTPRQSTPHYWNCKLQCALQNPKASKQLPTRQLQPRTTVPLSQTRILMRQSDDSARVFADTVCIVLFCLFQPPTAAHFISSVPQPRPSCPQDTPSPAHSMRTGQQCCAGSYCAQLNGAVLMQLDPSATMDGRQ